RKLLHRAWLWHSVATLFCRGGLGSFHEWRLGLLPGPWLCLGFRLPVGLDSVSLRLLGLRAYLRLGLAAWWILGGMVPTEDHPSSHELSPATASRPGSADRGREPGSHAHSAGKIVQPCANSQ